MNRSLAALSTSLWLTLSAACGATYHIHAPAPSSFRYAGQPLSPTLRVSDQRPEGSEFSEGTLSITYKFDQFSGDHKELVFLQDAVQNELGVRGIAPYQDGQVEPITITVREFGLRNRRSTGWSPMVTYARFSADFSQGGRTARIVAYSKQVKMPVWSMNELEGPCFNRPLHLMAGEIAAKINQAFVGGRVDDAQLASLASRAVSARGEEQLHVVSELGWSNHPAALPALLQLLQNDSEEVRGAALGAIGTLGMPESLGPLQQAYTGARTDTDRYLALKAIGDLASRSPEAFAVLSSVHASPGDNERDIREITKLYLEGWTPPVGAAVASR
jgi:hypothetical protein